MRAWLIIGLVAISPLHVQGSAAHEYQRNAQQLFCATIPIRGYPSAAQEQGSPKSQNDDSLCKRFVDAVVTNWPLIIIGGLGVWAALRTLKSIKRQADTMEEELVIANRAYLAIGEPELALKGMARIPILNLGKVPAKMTSISMDIRISKLPNLDLLYEAKVEKDAKSELVVPGTSKCALFIELPEKSLAEDVETVLAGAVTYQIGFKGETDILRFCPIYSTKRKAWHSAYSGVGIDFKGDIPRKGSGEGE